MSDKSDKSDEDVVRMLAASWPCTVPSRLSATLLSRELRSGDIALLVATEDDER